SLLRRSAVQLEETLRQLWRRTGRTGIHRVVQSLAGRDGTRVKARRESVRVESAEVGDSSRDVSKPATGVSALDCMGRVERAAGQTHAGALRAAVVHKARSRASL